MASAGSLIFELAADVSRLRTDMAKAQKDVQSTLDSIAKSSAVTGLKAGYDFAVEFARGFSDKIKAAIDQADALGKLAQRIGTTTESLSALGYAGSFAGVSMEDLTAAFKGMGNAFIEAHDASSNAAVAFKALGLNVEQLKQMDPAAAFAEIAEATSKFSNSLDKGAAINAIFGRSAQVLIPLLEGGKDGIKAATDEAVRMGLIISGPTAQAMSDLNDDLTRIGNISKGAAAVMARELQPTISEIARVMREAATEGTAWNATLKVITNTAKGLAYVLIGVGGVIGTFSKLLSEFDKVNEAGFDPKKQAAWRDSMKKAWSDARDQMSLVDDSQKRIFKTGEDVSNLDFGRASASWDVRPGVKYSDGLAAVADKAKKAKKEVDEFAKIMEQLAAEAAKMASMEDPFKEFLSNPKLQALPADQQQQAIEYKKWIVETTKALKDQKDAEDAAAEGRQEGLDSLIEQIDATEKFAEATRKSIDPTIAYIEAITNLEKAKAAGAVTSYEYAEAQKYFQKQMQDAINKTDPLKDQIKELQNAIEGFGQKSSDAFVDFIFGTKDVATNFAAMVSTILKDMAKMLVYRNIFEPMFKSVSSGPGTGWSDFFSNMFQKGPGMMAGGMVSPGVVYPVNEIPGRAEFFIPNVPGRVVTDAGAGTGGNVVVNVHMNRDDKADQDTTADSKTAAELGNRIAIVVRQVIATEKRAGGLLSPSR